MLSYHADMDSHTNPFELGLDRLVDLDTEADFIGKRALKAIRDNGISRKQVGVVIDGEPLTSPNTRAWTLHSGDQSVGSVTSAVYSPRLGKNIALAMVDIDFAEIGEMLTVSMLGGIRQAQVVEKPFHDPKKQLAAKNVATEPSVESLTIEVDLPETTLLGIAATGHDFVSESSNPVG